MGLINRCDFFFEIRENGIWVYKRLKFLLISLVGHVNFDGDNDKNSNSDERILVVDLLLEEIEETDHFRFF